MFHACMPADLLHAQLSLVLHLMKTLEPSLYKNYSSEFNYFLKVSSSCCCCYCCCCCCCGSCIRSCCCYCCCCCCCCCSCCCCSCCCCWYLSLFLCFVKTKGCRVKGLHIMKTAYI